jgi:hypothetical protein
MAPVTLNAVSQPLPTPDPTYFMVECNWTKSFTLTTSNPSDPTDWVSGIYVAKLTASSGRDRYIIFVVRDDSRSSSLVYSAEREYPSGIQRVGRNIALLIQSARRQSFLQPSV